MHRVIFLFFAICWSQSLNATVCSGIDDRKPTTDLRIARIRNGVSMNSLSKVNNCTATLIGRSCMITANHCRPMAQFAEFNVPLSLDDGTMIVSQLEYFFKIDSSSYLRGKDIDLGEDWLIFRVFPHSVSKVWPGDLFGFYDIEKDDMELPKNTELQIKGYGKSVDFLNATLRESFGSMIKLDLQKKVFYHNVDTTNGNSGSAVVDRQREKIIGIHSTGGCGLSSESIGNKAVLISGNTKLQLAILQCLESESQIIE